MFERAERVGGQDASGKVLYRIVNNRQGSTGVAPEDRSGGWDVHVPRREEIEILRRASFGFTQDRLLHIQEEDLKGWTDACTGELRRKIASAAPCISRLR